MQVVFRVDASIKIGTGHVMRCLTLAEALKEKGVQAEFICREHVGNLIDFIQGKGFKVHVLSMTENDIEMPRVTSFKSENVLDHAHWLGATQQQDTDACKVILKKLSPDWLIVDHYAIDDTWQIELQGTYKKLMVIDDLGDRRQLCDLLLDQNYGSTQGKYQALVPVHCKKLVGSSYALLRPEFAQWRKFSLNRRLKPNLKNILISLGGVDPDNYTGQVLEALKQSVLPKDILVKVIMGSTAPNLHSVQQQAQILPYKTEIKVNVSNMAELMANADLAIGAAGATTWERCCLGLPSIQLVIAENQKKIAENLSNIKAIKYIRNVDDINILMETTLIWMQSMGQTASQVCDGVG
jgi:UDP-2,4-diacetamido-2,4,6-trideoxy-beta-L-altropyranose hydrolase